MSTLRNLSLSQGQAQKTSSLVPRPYSKNWGKGPGLVSLANFSYVLSQQQLHALRDHVVASFCWQWHYKVNEQILLWSDYRQILWSKSSSYSLSSLNRYNLRFTKNHNHLVSIFKWSWNNSTTFMYVIGNGRRWVWPGKKLSLVPRLSPRSNENRNGGGEPGNEARRNYS